MTRIFFIVLCTFGLTATTTVASADSTHAMRVAAGPTTGLNATGGFGLQAEYDIPVINAFGPGRVYVAPTLSVYGAQSASLMGATGTGRYVLTTVHPRVRPWASLGAGVFVASQRAPLGSSTFGLADDDEDGDDDDDDDDGDDDDDDGDDDDDDDDDGAGGDDKGPGGNGPGIGSNSGAATSRVVPGITAAIGVDIDVFKKQMITVAVGTTQTTADGLVSAQVGFAWRF